MRCSNCDYELRVGDEECPRCSFRRAIQASPLMATDTELAATETTEAAPASAPEAPPLPAYALNLLPPEALPMPPMTQRAPTPTAPEETHTGRRRPVAFLAVGVPILLLSFLLYQHKPARTPTETKIAAIFAASDGPCRNGDRATCMASVDKVRSLHDMADGALLLGDYKIETYLRTQPGGAALAARWRQNQITAPELMTMGDVAYAKNLPISHSLWMYGRIKSDHVAVPQFNIGGAQLPPVPSRTP